MRIHFIWVSISTYANNGTAKFPISDEIGVIVQGFTAYIWNYPIKEFLLVITEA